MCQKTVAGAKVGGTYSEPLGNAFRRYIIIIMSIIIIIAIIIVVVAILV